MLLNSPCVPASSSRACWYAHQARVAGALPPGPWAEGSQLLAWAARAAIRSTCSHGLDRGSWGLCSMQAREHRAWKVLRDGGPCPRSSAGGKGPTQVGMEGPQTLPATPLPARLRTRAQQAWMQREVAIPLSWHRVRAKEENPCCGAKAGASGLWGGTSRAHIATPPHPVHGWSPQRRAADAPRDPRNPMSSPGLLLRLARSLAEAPAPAARDTDVS